MKNSSLSTAYEKHLSKQRLDRFIDPSDPSPERTALRYQANVRLSEALYPALHVVEIVVRNHLYAGIARKKGADWLIRSPEIWMRSGEVAKVRGAELYLKKQGRQAEPGRMIAELNFGFWTSLLDRYYEHQPHGGLWAGIIRSMFSGMKAGPDKIATIRARLNRIRELRNRVFHYEPIWHGRDLCQRHGEILETIGWVSAEMRQLTGEMDRFGAVYRECEPLLPRS